MRLALFLFPGHHLGAWRLPEAIPEFDVGIEHYVRAAQLAEEAKLDAIFFEDQAAVPRSNDILKGDTYGVAHPRAIHFDPMMLLPALAMATKHLGLAATSTATFNEPYNVARRFASIDFISNGRTGWNLVTSFNENEAQNFGLNAHLEHGKRYERASEFIDVVTGLWDSWEPGAVTRDKATGKYFDVEKMHFLRHEGTFFKVRGPLTMGRSPQVRPVIFQAGSSEPGRELAARTADVVFTLQTDIVGSRAFREDIRRRAVRFGRDSDKIKVLPGIIPIVGRTDREAEAYRERMRDLIPEELAISHLMPHAGASTSGITISTARCRICRKPMPGSRIGRRSSTWRAAGTCRSCKPRASSPRGAISRWSALRPRSPTPCRSGWKAMPVMVSLPSRPIFPAAWRILPGSSSRSYNAVASSGRNIPADTCVSISA